MHRPLSIRQMCLKPRWLLAGAAMLVLAACAGGPPPPEQELNAANLAVQQAEGSLAATHAPDDVALARRKLDDARAAFEREDYETARRLAEETLVDARIAEARADEVLATRSLEEGRATIDLLRQQTLQPAASGVTQ